MSELYADHPVLADGRKLKRLRQEQGLSVRELGELASVSTSVIYRLEKGRLRESWAQLHNIRKLAIALHTQPEDLQRDRAE